MMRIRTYQENLCGNENQTAKYDKIICKKHDLVIFIANTGRVFRYTLRKVLHQIHYRLHERTFDIFFENQMADDYFEKFMILQSKSNQIVCLFQKIVQKFKKIALCKKAVSISTSLTATYSGFVSTMAVFAQPEIDRKTMTKTIFDEYFQVFGRNFRIRKSKSCKIVVRFFGIGICQFEISIL